MNQTLESKIAWFMSGKVWFLDRMAWLCEDMENSHFEILRGDGPGNGSG